MSVLKHNDLPFDCCGAETGHVPAPSADYADSECRPLLLLLLAWISLTPQPPAVPIIRQDVRAKSQIDLKRNA